MAAKLHYRDGGVWRTAAALHYRDAGTWRNLKAAWYRDGGTWRQVFLAAYVRNPLILPDIDQNRFPATTNTVWISFYTDGTVSGFGTPNLLLWDQNWRVPTEAGIGSSYYIKATLASGSAPNGSSDAALGAWHPLNTTRGWTYITSGGAASTRSGTLNIYISTTASDADIVGSGTVFLSSSRDS